MYWCDFWAGWIGGISGIIVGHPLDTVKVRQQTLGSSRRLGVLKTIQTTFRYEKTRGFFKGMEFPILSSGILNSLMFGTYGVCMGEIMNKRHHEAPTALDAFICGCAGGFVTISLCCPVEVVKVKLQLQTAEGAAVNVWGTTSVKHYRGPWDCVKDLWRMHGLKGLYRGSGCMLYRDIPSAGLYMAVYQGLLNELGDRPIVHALGGGLAGVLSWASIIPFDVVKSRLQSDDFQNKKYRGTWDCMKQSVKSDGFSVLFRGFSAAVLRAFPVNAAIFYAYGWTRKEFFTMNGGDAIDVRERHSNKVSRIMGDLLLKGYKMLGSSCEDCSNVLLQDRSGSLLCVSCEEMKKLAPPPAKIENTLAEPKFQTISDDEDKALAQVKDAVCKKLTWASEQLEKSDVSDSLRLVQLIGNMLAILQDMKK
ncbi:unnamed protein product [Notodromas monacha]|uniref:Uncharacterized protein n=1 Tax=Notodromas monacha TaxID=399045 RepID=A0A7R9BVX9_9CRUS|nr:unnamed protein product [Notodromas monacha]CAG0921389.1 unnamed protein product [Notodromas monacha]